MSSDAPASRQVGHVIFWRLSLRRSPIFQPCNKWKPFIRPPSLSPGRLQEDSLVIRKPWRARNLWRPAVDAMR